MFWEGIAARWMRVCSAQDRARLSGLAFQTTWIVVRKKRDHAKRGLRKSYNIMFMIVMICVVSSKINPNVLEIMWSSTVANIMTLLMKKMNFMNYHTMRNIQLVHYIFDQFIVNCHKHSFFFRRRHSIHRHRQKTKKNRGQKIKVSMSSKSEHLVLKKTSTEGKKIRAEDFFVNKHLHLL